MSSKKKMTSTHTWECRGQRPVPGARGCPSLPLYLWAAGPGIKLEVDRAKEDPKESDYHSRFPSGLLLRLYTHNNVDIMSGLARQTVQPIGAAIVGSRLDST